ncbi:hypothetical protein I307_00658 [Cryptococcus deuterogattii 99/473]|uniref:RRM domain-containing protein n=1 Tax=Cryptococcus deuterogattii Ram5 TaxID=1296110 RepID=A0A0D0V6H0_9TREE|nr:hypothetical protein I313_01403 [Cryptococcus deuterogattii Ram5]KIY59589.1 hypothetical protein I307_00658 [Cryptococcus deuterogattii 99/473]
MTAESVDRMNDKILRHLIQYSPLLPPAARTQLLAIPSSAGRSALISQLNNSSVHFPLSQFPHLLSGAINFPVPVFTTWGLVEDVNVIEKFRTGEYGVQNLAILDEATSRLVEVGGVKLRLLGLGGTVADHKLFDYGAFYSKISKITEQPPGEGHGSIAGAQGTMWTTALQIGELIDTAQRTFSPDETRLFVSTTPTSRNGLMTLVSNAIKADLTISCGLHFRYPVSYNEYSIHPDFESYRRKLQQAKDDFKGLFDQVRDRVFGSLDDKQTALLHKSLSAIDNVPIADDGMWANTWHWSLSDAGFGNMLLSITDSRVSAETKSSGVNFAHRTGKGPALPTGTSIPSAPSGLNSVKSFSIRPGPGPIGARPPPTQGVPSAHGAPGAFASQGRPPIRPNMGPGFSTRPPSGPRNTRQFGSGPASSMGGMSQSQMFAQAQAQAAVSGKTAAAASLANGKKDEKNEKPEGDKGVNEEEKKEKLATNGNAIPEKIKYTDKKEEKKDVKPIEKSEDKEKSEGENPWGEDKEEKKGSNPWADDVSDEGEKKDEDKGEFIEDAKPKRYSLYIKGLPTPTTEEELKAVVGESGQKAIQVKIIFDQFTKQQKVGCYDSMLWTRANLAQDFGYLDFDSEEVMNEALKASTGTIRDTPVNVSISKPTVPRYNSRQFSGPGGRGRGSFRGRGRGFGSGPRKERGEREGSGSGNATAGREKKA